MKRIICTLVITLCLFLNGADSFGANGPGGGGQGGGSQPSYPSRDSDSLIYWWANNDEFAELDESDTMTAIITWTENGVEKTDTLTVDRAYRSSRSWGGEDWGSQSSTRTTAVTASNLAHDEVSSKTVVYYIDTSPYTVNASQQPEYTFMIEFDAQNGTHYYATFEESNVWQGWYLKDHICGGVDFIAGSPAVPEPNSCILILFGCGILGLKRKSKKDEETRF